MSPRVLAGGIWHETNSFCPLPSDLAAFRRFALHEGEAMIRAYRDTNHEIGGIIAGAEALGLTLVPSIFAGAVPGGLVTREALDHVVGRLCADIREDPALDGAVLSLHGAMVAEGVDEADRHVLERVREALGPDRPLVASFDLHANLSVAAVAPADILVGYDTLPHLDMAERGREAVSLLHRLIGGMPRPARAFRKLPLLISPQMGVTGDAPMAAVMAACFQEEARPGVLTCSVVQGFPYCDVPQLGMAVLAYADDQPRADAAADRIAGMLWDRREAMLPGLQPPDDAVRQALAANRGPFFLVEPADNIGGGSPGDGTHLLRALLASPAPRGTVVLWDPQAAALAAHEGVGRSFRGTVGGKTLALHGDPVPVAGTVTFAGPVAYRRDSTYFRGAPVDLGLCAVVRDGEVNIVLTSERAMPFDTLHLRSVGIAPEEQGVLTLKCGSNWASIFGGMATGFVYVDTPGITSSNVERMPYSRLTRPLYPLDRGVTWSPGAG